MMASLASEWWPGFAGMRSAPSLVDVTPVVNLVAVGERMQDLANTMHGLKNQYDGMQEKRDAEAQKVADAKRALDDCLAGG
jgi:hypothetical protein